MSLREWFGGGEDLRKKGVPAASETGDSEPKQPKEGERMSPEEERQAVDGLEDQNRPKNPVDEMERKGLK